MMTNNIPSKNMGNNSSIRHYMNLIEFTVILAILLGIIVGWMKWGNIVGCMIGVSVAIGIGLVIYTCYYFISGLLFHGIPRLPKCEHGICIKKRNYSLVMVYENGDSDWCCGCKSFYRKRGRRFLKVTENGEFPYLVWIPKKFKWLPDEEGSDCSN